MLACTGCSGLPSLEPSPSDTVERFSKSLSDFDVDGMMDCCDASTQQMLDGAFGLADGVLGLMGAELDTKSLLVMFGPWIETLGTETSGERSDITVTPTNMRETIDGNRATVDCVLRLEQTSGGSTIDTEGDVTFKLVKEDGEWRLDLSQDLANEFMASWT